MQCYTIFDWYYSFSIVFPQKFAQAVNKHLVFTITQSSWTLARVPCSTIPVPPPLWTNVAWLTFWLRLENCTSWIYAWNIKIPCCAYCLILYCWGHLSLHIISWQKKKGFFYFRFRIAHVRWCCLATKKIRARGFFRCGGNAANTSR